MKVKVLKPQRTVWSAETKEMTLDIDGNTYVVRQHEDDNHGENWVSVNGESFVEIYTMEDSELKELLTESAHAIRSGMFDNEGDEYDSIDIIEND